MRLKLGLAAALLTAITLVSTSASAAPSQQRVVGGNATTIEEWPWQVAIARPPSAGGNGYDRQFCGGSLVAARVVLTAAHCVSDSGAFKSASEFSVITGRTTLSSTAGAETPAQEVIYFVAGPGGPQPQPQSQPATSPQLYDDASSRWDIALLQLAAPAPTPARPVLVANAAERGLWEPDDPAFVTGWGDTTGAMTYADELQEGEVEIVADPDCAFSQAGGFDPQTMVCAGLYPEGGKDTCQGDSGGPLVVPAGTGQFRLVGVTSFGTGCALPSQPGVYARVGDNPMRDAIAAGVALAGGGAAGGTGGGGSADDATAPQTTLIKHPRKRSKKRTARFGWTADESARFSCTLDGRLIESCESPFVQRVKRTRHSFSVQATDGAGNIEAEPAAFSWKVKKKHKRRG